MVVSVVFGGICIRVRTVLEKYELWMRSEINQVGAGMIDGRRGRVVIGLDNQGRRTWKVDVLTGG